NQFNKYKDDESTIFKGIDDLISKLAKNVKLAILTNNKSQYAEEVLEKFNLSNYFSTIVGFNDVSEVKPNPEGILKILDKWNLKPEDAIFIGDMTTDIEAGKAANVTMICVASGLAQKETLKKHQPNILVDNTEQLIKLFNI
ncbi:MAG: HAD-IA family hydrolase, partial [Candidatus Lokiarchaeota archaeon]|nr:HAD-IA family hydrolase [Candidatus Lokiarchaeota archaeon]